MLILRPVTFPNFSKMSINFCTSSRLGCRKIAASSAYKDSLRRDCLPLSGDNCPSSVAKSRIRCKVSMAKMKSYGERGSPCRKPRLCLIEGPEIPLRSTVDDEEVSINASQLRQCGLKLRCCSSSKRYSHETVSKALVISSLKRSAGVRVRW